MGTVESAPKDKRGYTCPSCGRQGLNASAMAVAWSPAAWDYVPVHCQECQEFWHRRYLEAVTAEAEGPDALRRYLEALQNRGERTFRDGGHTSGR